MNHQSVPRANANNHYHNFGGGKPDFISKQGYGIVPFMSRYAVDGLGRDNYISWDNGGLHVPFAAELQATHGTFMEKKKTDL